MYITERFASSPPWTQPCTLIVHIDFYEIRNRCASRTLRVRIIHACTACDNVKFKRVFFYVYAPFRGTSTVSALAYTKMNSIPRGIVWYMFNNTMGYTFPLLLLLT